MPTGPWYCRKCESQERSARVVSIINIFGAIIIMIHLHVTILLHSAVSYVQAVMELLREQIRLAGHMWFVHCIYQKLDLVT